MRRRPMLVVPAALAVLALLGLVATTRGSDSETVSAEEGVHYVTDFLKARTSGAMRLDTWNETLADVLPNVEYRRSDGVVHPLSDLAVVGTVTAVEKGRAFTIPGCVVTKPGALVGDCDAPGGTPAPFDAPNGLWWSIHATVTVERSIGSSQSPDQVKVALPLDDPAKFDLMAAGLKGLGRVVMFLKANSPLVEYEPSLYIVHRDGGYIATVAADGTLKLPMLESEQASEQLVQTPKLTDLESRGRAPLRTVDVATGHARAGSK
ncbi:MAG TPA: hypothetical protein VHF47_14205 [Acidimicrobiales bacterium]|nr:hypothetical protein [Acidimicrobiales bacterium]